MINDQAPMTKQIQIYQYLNDLDQGPKPRSMVFQISKLFGHWSLLLGHSAHRLLGHAAQRLSPPRPRPGPLAWSNGGQNPPRAIAAGPVLSPSRSRRQASIQN